MPPLLLLLSSGLASIRSCFPRTEVSIPKPWARSVLTHKQPVPRNAGMSGQPETWCQCVLSPWGR